MNSFCSFGFRGKRNVLLLRVYLICLYIKVIRFSSLLCSVTPRQQPVWLLTSHLSGKQRWSWCLASGLNPQYKTIFAVIQAANQQMLPIKLATTVLISFSFLRLHLSRKTTKAWATDQTFPNSKSPRNVDHCVFGVTKVPYHNPQYL